MEDFFNKKKAEPKREKDMIGFSFYKDHCEHSGKDGLGGTSEFGGDQEGGLVVTRVRDGSLNEGTVEAEWTGRGGALKVRVIGLAERSLGT